MMAMAGLRLPKQVWMWEKNNHCCNAVGGRAWLGNNNPKGFHSDYFWNVQCYKSSNACIHTIIHSTRPLYLRTKATLSLYTLKPPLKESTVKLLPLWGGQETMHLPLDPMVKQFDLANLQILACRGVLWKPMFLGMRFYLPFLCTCTLKSRLLVLGAVKCFAGSSETEHMCGTVGPLLSSWGGKKCMWLLACVLYVQLWDVWIWRH